MPSSGVQAFLTLPEQWAFVRRVACSVPCHLLISSGVAPAWNLRSCQILDEATPMERWTMYFLLHPPIDTLIGTQPNLGRMDAASGPLVVSSGRFEEGVLEEFACTFNARELEAAACWKPILDWLRRHTMVGAIAKGENGGEGTVYKNCRFSSGALAAFEAGTVLKQLRTQRFWFEPKPSKIIEFPLE